MPSTIITVSAKPYEDEDDCPAAAAADYAAQHDLQGWDLAPRWADAQRTEIILTVPDLTARPMYPNHITTRAGRLLRAQRQASGLLTADEIDQLRGLKP